MSAWLRVVEESYHGDCCDAERPPKAASLGVERPPLAAARGHSGVSKADPLSPSWKQNPVRERVAVEIAGIHGNEFA